VKSGAIINRREILDMSDPNWIFAANHYSESILSKSEQILVWKRAADRPNSAPQTNGQNAT
jgi:hypothetical protein